MVHNSFSCPRLDAPLTGTRLLYAHLQFRLQKCRKPVKQIINFFLSVITQKQLYFKVKIFNEIYTYLFFLIVKFEPIICNTSKFIAC
jgi:hypothetical protein